MDQIEAVRVFVAVAKHGSLAEAARQLRISPSAATRSLAWLEDRLGLILLARTTRSIRLTERGEIYLESCQQILADLDSAERRVRGEDAAPRGSLKITAPIVFGRLHILPIVTELLHTYPALSIRLGLSDRNVHLVEEGVDVGVRIGELADSSLIAVRLGSVGRVLVASPAYLKARGIPASPADLVHHDTIAFEGLEPTNEWRLGHTVNPVRLNPRLLVNTAEAAIAAAEAGAGITRCLSYQVKDSVFAGRLVPVLQSFAPPDVPVSVIYPARRIASANVAAFVTAARRYFSAAPLAPMSEWRRSALKRKPRSKG